ncbi:MAG: hypothetical protein ABIK38_05935 [candidate division WOR-3 bacterium]
MSSSLRESLYTFGYMLCGAVAGWLNWRLVPFGTRMPVLPFLAVGIAGGLIYAGMRLRGFGFGLMMVVLLFFVQLALTPPLRLGSIVRAAMWAFPVGSSFLLSALLFKLLNRFKPLRFLFMALLVGLGYVLVAVLFRLRLHQPADFGGLKWQFLAGALLGGVLGVLLEMLEYVFPPERYHRSQFILPE